MNSKDAAYYDLGRNEMKEFIPKGISRLLDVGCGAGTFGASIARDQSCEVWGIEIMPEAAKQASEKLYKVFVGTAELQIKLVPESYFDCVCFNDVLEHLLEPAEVLSAVKRVLSPNGRVVCSIPNIRFWRALRHIIKEKDFRYTSWGTFDSTHLRFFTKLSIERLFAEQGYKIEHLQGINEQIPEGWVLRNLLRIGRLVASNWVDDTRFVQFAVVARPVNH